MARARNGRLARLTERRAREHAAGASHRAVLEARVALGAALRHSLVQFGVDPASVRMLQVCDEAEAELAAPPIPGAGRELGVAGEKPEASGFWDQIERLAERYHAEPAIDFARASLAQTLAWCVARQVDRSLTPNDGEAATDEAGDFAADLLQKQRKQQR